MNIIEARSHRNPDGPRFVKGGVTRADTVVEAFRYKHDRRKSRLLDVSRLPSVIMAGASLENSDIDVSWLAAASDSYKISADPRDYVLTDIPIVTVDIPNRNLQGFPYEEVSYFDPLYGKLVYQTFNCKPTHQDHDNKDPLKAKGVIFDTALQYVKAYNIWKIRILAGWDRTKDPYLVNSIVRKERTSYSMGALVENFVCSACGAIDTNMQKCSCMLKGKGAIIDGKLVYQQCVGVNYIENSSVDDPADVTADTDSIWG